MMQSAAAAYAANAGADVSSSSYADSDDRSAAVSLRFDTDSDFGLEHFVSPLESNQEECT